jgi:hypothetical protein
MDNNGTEVWIPHICLSVVPHIRLSVVAGRFLAYLCSCLFLFLQVGGLLKNLPSVAALTAERDGEIRKAALNTLATAYKNLGKAFPFLFPALDS